MSPEKLMIELKKGATAKTQETFDAVYTICCEQRERCINDFSVATIAKLGNKRGVPKAQSLRNKSGEKYRALIQSFKDRGENVKSKRTTKDEDWIDEISNPKHQLLARIQCSELKAANQKLREIVPPNSVIDVYDYKPLMDSEHQLTKQEKRALEYLISNAFTKKWRFIFTEYGEVIDENGSVVFKPGTVDALKKAIKFL